MFQSERKIIATADHFVIHWMLLNFRQCPISTHDNRFVIATFEIIEKRMRVDLQIYNYYCVLKTYKFTETLFKIYRSFFIHRFV